MMPVPISRDDVSFWVDEPDPRPCPPVAGDVSADVAIVGGGFSGLSAAYHLLKERPGLDVIVLESNSIGSGASGRNTGMLAPRVGGNIVDLCRRYGLTEARRFYQASVDAVRHVTALIAEEDIACELEQARQVKAAITTRQAHALATEARLLEELGFEAPLYDADAMALISPVAYRAGLCYPHSALLNPVRLCRELKRVVLQRGGRVYEQSPVHEIVPGHPPTIRHATGSVVARHVVLATNGYTPRLGLLQGQVIPIQTHVIQTDPLTPAQLASINWPGRAPFFEAGRVFNYFRLTAGNRIVFGGGRPVYAAAANDRSSGATDIAVPRIWETLRRLFATRFPALRDLPVAHCWTGTLGMTLDHMAIVGELAGSPGIFFAGGWNGHGVAMATASGAHVAEHLLGNGAARPQFPWMRGAAPPIQVADPVRACGLSVYLAGLQLMDRVEASMDRLRPGKNSTRRNEVTTWTLGN